MSYKLQCEICRKEFIHRNGHTTTCSTECRTTKNRNRYGRSVGVNTGIPPGTVGVISEYYVITHLLEKGFAVFHAASPCCYCDLLAVKDGKTFSFEVRTCYEGDDGRLTYSKILNKGQAVPEYFGLVERNTRKVIFVNVSSNEKVEL